MKLPPPDDRETWQDLVDSAYGCLALDSARQYGLVKGGPTINVKKAAKILELGRAKGITPRPGAAERFIADLQEYDRARKSSSAPTVSPQRRKRK